MKTEIFENEIGKWIIFIGKNRQDNWRIIDDASPTDIWFHVLDSPSCHVILKTEYKLTNISNDVLKKCALLCKINSKAKTEKKTQIMYTQIENIKKTHIVGEVIAHNFKIITI